MKSEVFLLRLIFSSTPRAYICTLPEPTRVDSGVQHVQTPEAAKKRSQIPLDSNTAFRW